MAKKWFTILAASIFAVGCASWSEFGGIYRVVSPEGWTPPDERAFVYEVETVLREFGFERSISPNYEGLIDFEKAYGVNSLKFRQLDGANSRLGISVKPSSGRIGIRDYTRIKETEFVKELLSRLQSRLHEKWGVNYRFERLSTWLA